MLLGFAANAAIAEEARCEAKLADGTVRRMRGDRQTVAVRRRGRDDRGLQGRGRRHRVSCAWAERGDSREVGFSVAEQRTVLRTTAFVLIGVGCSSS